MKVLIADDEMKVCKLIQHLVDWDALEMEIVDIVNDGEAALKVICDCKPDIVITDIRMPVYDGLELIRRGKEINPDINFIVISGYSQFEYAQQAIKYGVKDYLLKPLKKRELESVLSEIRDSHVSFLLENRKQEELQSIVQTSREHIKESLLIKLLQDPALHSLLKEMKLEEVNKKYECSFKQGYFTGIRVRMFYALKLKDLEVKSFVINKVHQIIKEKLPEICIEFVSTGYFTGIRVRMFYALKLKDLEVKSFVINKVHQIIKEKLPEICIEFVSTICRDEIVILINTAEKNCVDLVKLFKSIRIELLNFKGEFHEVHFVAGLGRQCDCLANIDSSFEEAQYAVMNRMGEKDSYYIEYRPDSVSGIEKKEIFDRTMRQKILECQERVDIEGIQRQIIELRDRLDQYKNDGSGIEKKEIFDRTMRQKILECQERVDIEGIQRQIIELRDRLDQYKNDGKLVYECYVELIQTLQFGAKDYRNQLGGIFEENYEDYYWAMLGFEKLFSWIIEDVEQEYGMYRKSLKEAVSKPIRDAKKYIQDNFNSHLNLEMVSEYVGFNSAYFSTLFKKETGKNFLEYVTDLRIQKAKNYLIQTDQDVAEIALAVGYSDLKYFSKLFKKTTGINPSEFRKLYS